MKVVARGVAESPLTEPRNTNTTGTKSPEMVTRESHQMPLQCWLDYCSKLKLVRLRNSEAAQCPCSLLMDLLDLLPDFHAQTSGRCQIWRYVHMLIPCRLAVDFQCEEVDVHNWVKCSCQWALLWLLHVRIHPKHGNEDNDDESMHYAAIPTKDLQLQNLAPLLSFSWVLIFQTKYLDIAGLISFTFNIYMGTIWTEATAAQKSHQNSGVLNVPDCQMAV